MGKPTGFLEYDRAPIAVRPKEERRHDFREVYLPMAQDTLQQQAARCMDCGVPFCHDACPLGNVIPDWNDTAYQDLGADALLQLHSTNNFPEFTGRLCPAPCEAACVLGINGKAVNIKAVELSIIENGFNSGLVGARPPGLRTDKCIAVVGSGPAGLAAADQLNQLGHRVVVFERADRVGGLLRYGIPDFKMEKAILERRLTMMRQEGIEFVVKTHVGMDVGLDHLQGHYDAVVLATGATCPRDVEVQGRRLQGIFFAMDYLAQQNRVVAGDDPSLPSMVATDKDVIILGGGDTGADCLGTALRQRARSVTQIEIGARPPDARAVDNPWPQWPQVFRVSAAHEEGGDRLFELSTLEFAGDGNGHVVALRAKNLATDEVVQIPCDMVLLAIGFSGPEGALLRSANVTLTAKSTVWRDRNFMTSVPGIFTAGDAQRGQSLVVWAIADGRNAAAGVHRFLAGLP